MLRFAKCGGLNHAIALCRQLTCKREQQWRHIPASDALITCFCAEVCIFLPQTQVKSEHGVKGTSFYYQTPHNVHKQGPDCDDMPSFFPCEIEDAIQYINLGYGAQAPKIVIL